MSLHVVSDGLMDDPATATDHPKPKPSGYGEFVIVGYNGRLPVIDRGRRKSKIMFKKRKTANGVTLLKRYEVRNPHSSPAMPKGCRVEAKKHAISHMVSRKLAVILEYMPDKDTDMFQIGRSSDNTIDFIVTNTIPGNKTTERKVLKNPISRFACRILADRNNPHVARIYASGFNTAQKIVLGEKAAKWQDGFKFDGLTTNGVLINHPRGPFCGGDANDAKDRIWREVSIGGDVFSLRESRSVQQKGSLVGDETNVLMDGTLIDVCGATLLWRSAEGLAQSPSKMCLEKMVDELNAARIQCPVGLDTLVIPQGIKALSPAESKKQKQPYVYLKCGHVQGHHDGGQDKKLKDHCCPMCLQVGPIVKMSMGIEAAFYVDDNPPTFAFNPCGHMATEKTVKYWASMAIPHGTNGFDAVCPFCATPLVGSPGYVRLIFQDNVD